MDALLLVRIHERPGALERVLGAIRRKTLPVRRLSLHEPVSRLRDVVIRFDAAQISAERMVAELSSLYDVEEARFVARSRDPGTREMALVHLRSANGFAPDVAGRVVRHGPDGVVVELTGTPAEVDDILERLRATGTLATAVRTGEVVVPAGESSTKEPREAVSPEQGEGEA